MKVLVACEESQTVCKAFRALGHEAYSCDIIPCSGGHPEWHIQDDVRNHLEGWDLIILHPPCTDLAVSGARWFKQKGNKPQEAYEFAMALWNAPCKKKAMENPIGKLSTLFRKPDQIIQPWQFGHGEVKATCLWLEGLPKLTPTNIVEGREAKVHRMPPSPERAKLRSKTYSGIANAMAQQWQNKMEVKSGCDANGDGIPPNNKLLGILPNEL